MSDIPVPRRLVLMIDDDEELYTLVAMTIECDDLPIDVRYAASGDTGKQMFRDLQPNIELIVLDYHIKDDRGDELARHFRDSSYTGPMLGASSDYTVEPLFKQAGCLLFCRDKSKLPDRIREILGL